VVSNYVSLPFEVRYDFRIKTTFGLSLPLVVCWRAHLHYLLLFAYNCTQHILCCVFVSLRLVYCMLPVSLNSPFSERLFGIL
jgi:hypothetical protein